MSDDAMQVLRDKCGELVRERDELQDLVRQAQTFGLRIKRSQGGSQFVAEATACAGCDELRALVAELDAFIYGLSRNGLGVVAIVPEARAAIARHEARKERGDAV